MYSKILPSEDPSVIVDHLFRIFDRDGNGTIDFKEFVMATDITTSGEPEEKLRWTFRVRYKQTADINQSRNCFKSKVFTKWAISDCVFDHISKTI